MSLIQRYVNDRWTSQHSLNHHVFINSDLVQALQWWTVDDNLSVGRPFVYPPSTLSVNVTTDASIECWGGHVQGSGLHSVLFHALWTQKRGNFLELWAVQLMLLNLKHTLLSQVIWNESDNMTTAAHINQEGGVHQVGSGWEVGEVAVQDVRMSTNRSVYISSEHSSPCLVWQNFSA